MDDLEINSVASVIMDQQTQTVDVNVTENKSGKTPVSIFQELCTAFDLGVPMYSLVEEKGEAHKKTFLMDLTTAVLGVKVVGEAKTKMHAKHDAAKQMIEMIKETAECGGDLGEVPNQTLQKCSKRLQTFEVVTEDLIESKNSAGDLTALALTNNLAVPDYDTVSVTGPAHNRKFVMTCKMLEHTTQGEGKSKKIAKNIAAEKMLQLIGPKFAENRI